LAGAKDNFIKVLNNKTEPKKQSYPEAAPTFFYRVPRSMKNLAFIRLPKKNQNIRKTLKNKRKKGVPPK